METNMTKVKDLATVIVDNAFLQFPIDSERYELRAVLSHLEFLGLLKSVGVSHVGGGWALRVSDFLHESGRLVVRATHAYMTIRYTEEYDGSLVTWDRARRLEMSLRDRQMLEVHRSDPDVRGLVIRELVWHNIVRKLGQVSRREVDDCVLKDWRLST
jgi:hypothetical protein